MFKKLALVFTLTLSLLAPVQSYANDFVGGVIAGGILGAIIMNGQNGHHHRHQFRQQMYYDEYNPYQVPVCRNRIVNRFNNYYGVWERVVVTQCYNDSF